MTKYNKFSIVSFNDSSTISKMQIPKKRGRPAKKTNTSTNTTQMVVKSTEILSNKPSSIQPFESRLFFSQSISSSKIQKNKKQHNIRHCRISNINESASIESASNMSSIDSLTPLLNSTSLSDTTLQMIPSIIKLHCTNKKTNEMKNNSIPFPSTVDCSTKRKIRTSILSIKELLN